MQVKSLESHHEIIGDLSEVVKLEDGQIKLIFTINKEVHVPQSAFAETDLKEYLGDRIGITNIDGVYKIRRISPCLKKGKNKHQVE